MKKSVARYVAWSSNQQSRFLLSMIISDDLLPTTETLGVLDLDEFACESGTQIPKTLTILKQFTLTVMIMFDGGAILQVSNMDKINYKKIKTVLLRYGSPESIWIGAAMRSVSTKSSYDLIGSGLRFVTSSSVTFPNLLRGKGGYKFWECTRTEFDDYFDTEFDDYFASMAVCAALDYNFIQVRYVIKNTVIYLDQYCNVTTPLLVRQDGNSFKYIGESHGFFVFTKSKRVTVRAMIALQRLVKLSNANRKLLARNTTKYDLWQVTNKTMSTVPPHNYVRVAVFVGPDLNLTEINKNIKNLKHLQFVHMAKIALEGQKIFYDCTLMEITKHRIFTTNLCNRRSFLNFEGT